MPRKNARPAARKARKKKSEKMAQGQRKQRAVIGHHNTQDIATMALLAGSLGLLASSPPRDEQERA